MASPTSAFVVAGLKAPKQKVSSLKRSKRSKCLISVKAKKNYDTLKTSLRHFVASEPAVPAFAAIFSVALNEATTCEMEEASEEAEKESRRESKKKGEAEVVA